MPAAKCTTEIIDRVVILVQEGLSIKKIAAAVGLAEGTILNWKQQSSKFYNSEFADAFESAKDEFDCGKVKAGQSVQAKKHKLRKVYKELQNQGPEMPRSSYTKALIVRYAASKLKLRLNMKMTRPAMLYECERKVEELADYQMVVVREETADVDPNQQAVKNVLTNKGDPGKRWNFKEEHEIDAADPLKRLIEQIGGVKMGLPGESEIPDFSAKEDDE
jgi:transposase